MTKLDDTPQSELEQRLRREAAAWGGEPSMECSSRWRAAVEAPTSVSVRRSVLRHRLVGAAAAVLVTGLVSWAIIRGISPDGPEPAAAHQDLARDLARDLAWWDHTVGPLEREYTALRHDVGAVADVMWQGVPRPLRSLFGG